MDKETKRFHQCRNRMFEDYKSVRIPKEWKSGKEKKKNQTRLKQSFDIIVPMFRNALSLKSSSSPNS